MTTTDHRLHRPLPPGEFKHPRERPSEAVKRATQDFVDSLARKHGVDPYRGKRG